MAVSSFNKSAEHAHTSLVWVSSLLCVKGMCQIHVSSRYVTWLCVAGVGLTSWVSCLQCVYSASQEPEPQLESDDGRCFFCFATMHWP